MITKMTTNPSVKTISKERDKKYNFNLSIQRNSVWKDDKRSLFLHTLMQGYPFPAVYAVEMDEVMYMLDGKQRFLSVLNFIDDEFALDKETPNVIVDDQEVIVANKKFEELPEDLRDNILSSQFLIYVFKNITEAEINEIFLRLNYGMPLTKIELTRVMAGNTAMTFVKEVGKMDFFRRCNLTDSQKNRFIDEEVILQILLLITKNFDTGIGKELNQFCREVKEVGISDNIKEIVVKTTEYLSEAIPEPEKFLRKTNIPMVFIQAIRAMQDEIEPLKFGGWLQSAFKDENRLRHGRYSDACSSSTAKKDKVLIRLEEINKDYEKHIKNAHDFKTKQVVFKEFKMEEKTKEPEEIVDEGQEIVDNVVDSQELQTDGESESRKEVA